MIRKNKKDLMKNVLDCSEYQGRRYDEHALSILCHDSIVLRDRFINTLSGGSECVTASVRRDKWRPRKEGPSVLGGVYTYDWNIEPDTTYAVSTNMFDPEDREELELKPWHRWLAEENAACPYLTIEYKCSEKTGKRSDATYHTAAASLLWLYQCKRIRDELNLPLDKLRHYSITTYDSTYTISEAFCRGTSYHLQMLATGNLTEMDSLLKYIEWSNAIHAWGLGPNALSFKEDIETLIKLKRGA